MPHELICFAKATSHVNDFKEGSNFFYPYPVTTTSFRHHLDKRFLLLFFFLESTGVLAFFFFFFLKTFLSISYQEPLVFSEN